MCSNLQRNPSSIQVKYNLQLNISTTNFTYIGAGDITKENDTILCKEINLRNDGFKNNIFN